MDGKDSGQLLCCRVFSVLILAGLSGLRVQTLPRFVQSPQVPEAVVSQAAPAVVPPEYPQTADGFYAQMSAAVAAYQQGHGAEGRRLLEQFRLPDSAKWFADQFGPEQGETLSKRYDRLFENYVNSVEKNLEEVASKKGRKLKMSLQPGTSEQPSHGKLSGIVPAKEPACFNVSFQVHLTGKGDFRMLLWEDTFSYQGGAFRLVGRGAWPFWVWQEGS